MKKLCMAAIAVAVLSMGMSGWALWRTRGASSTSHTPPATSSKEALVVVPDGTGKGGLAVANSLKLAGLKWQISMVPSATVAKGKLISQNPRPGTKVPKGATVQLTVSSGPP